MSIRTIYHKTVLTGGGSTALDGIDGSNLLDGDRAFMVIAGVFTVYYLDADSGLAESSPGIIAPDLNAGDKRWIKCT